MLTQFFQSYWDAPVRCHNMYKKALWEYVQTDMKEAGSQRTKEMIKTWLCREGAMEGVENSDHPRQQVWLFISEKQLKMHLVKNDCVTRLWGQICTRERQGRDHPRENDSSWRVRQQKLCFSTAAETVEDIGVWVESKSKTYLPSQGSILGTRLIEVKLM